MKIPDLLRIAVASVLGSGYSPIAPGTAGSLVSVVLFHLAIMLGLSPLLLLLPILPVSYLGCLWGQRLWGEDPPRVVADEFAGCWIACAMAPVTWGVAGLAAAFILFRVMDIWKPWPVSFFDRMKNPAGILLDDLASGVIAGGLMVAGAFAHGQL